MHHLEKERTRFFTSIVFLISIDICGSSSRYHELVCSVVMRYCLIILTYFWSDLLIFAIVSQSDDFNNSSFKRRVYIFDNSYRPSVLFVGHKQTVQAHISTVCLNICSNERKHPTTLKRKWTVPIDTSGKFDLA